MIFRAEPGRVFVGGDISQQEPKITSHISQDPNMLKVFREGKDIYASIAQSIYHNSYEDNLEFFDKEKTKTNLEGKERRKTGKTIILATMYGMGPGTVARKLKLGSKEEAQAMIDAYYSDKIFTIVRLRGTMSGFLFLVTLTYTTLLSKSTSFI